MPDWCQLNRWHGDVDRLVGRRVRLTDAGVGVGLRGKARSRFGKVTRVDPIGDFKVGWLYVQRDGLKRPDCYSPSFWELRV